MFETTIRVIGGLLSAYHLKGENVFLEKAKLVADKLMVAFDQSPTDIPLCSVDMTQNRAFGPSWNGAMSSVSEVGSIQLEWQDLSRATGDPIYRQVVDNAMSKISLFDVILTSRCTVIVAIIGPLVHQVH